MKKRILTAVLAFSLIAASVFGFTACSKVDSGNEPAKSEVTALVENNDETIKKLQQEIAALQEQIKNLSDKTENMEEEIKILLDRIKELEDKNKPVLDEATAIEIKTAYANKYECQVEKISLRFYGEYNEAYVIYATVSNFSYGMKVTRETVDNVEFVYSCGNTLKVYYNDDIYSLQEAFDNGYLTHNDLIAIRELTGNYITLI